MFWSNLNYKFEFFLAEKCTVGAVGTVAAPTNRFAEAAGVISHLYKSICREATVPTVPTNRFVGAVWEPSL